LLTQGNFILNKSTHYSLFQPHYTKERNTKYTLWK